MIALVSPGLVLSLYLLGLHPVGFTARSNACRELPPNIRATDDLRSVVEGLLTRSQTLRDQCRRIGAAPRTYVSLALTAGSLGVHARARSVSRRYHTGLLVVDVEIPPASQDFAELLAHELEHVTEFIEGVDFKALAKSRRSGIVQCDAQGSFESERAQRAGLAAAAEVERDPALAWLGRNLPRPSRTTPDSSGRPLR